jgi:large subunit ribosomal protein L32
MAVPKRRTSNSRQGHRRSHHRLIPVQIQYCPRCNEPVMPHRVCSNCGYYQGRDAIVLPDDKQGK